MNDIAIPQFIGPIDADVRIPGSKSLTNRALLVAALADGESLLENALSCEDSDIFSTCLCQLGIPVKAESASASFRVGGLGGTVPSRRANLFVGNAGTAARFITALLSLVEGEYCLDGVSAMRRRPMGELLRILRGQGCEIVFGSDDGCMPFTLKSKRFEGGRICMQSNQTSQQLSALLMIAPYARRDTTIDIEGTVVSQPYLDMTCALMEDFGVIVSREGYNSFQIEAGQRYQPIRYLIEPDASNASYFFAAAAVTGGRVRVNDLSIDSCQGDVRFVELLETMGCKVNSTSTYIEVIGPEKLSGIDVDMNDISDTVPTLAAIAPFASSPVTIRNVEHIRGKETDRIAAVTTELKRMGIGIEEFDGGLTIHPGIPSPAEIHTYNDHRMAMAFAVTGLKAPGIVIRDPACTGKTFPDFFDRFSLMLTPGSK